MVTITMTGGVGVIGGNQIHAHDQSTNVLLDFGEKSNIYNKFFKGFSGPRNTYGLKDFFDLGLIPKVDGLYRADLLKLAGHAPQEPKCDGVILSHPHLDHYANIPFLHQDIPLYASYWTLRMLRADESLSATKWRGSVTSFIERIAPPDLTVVKKKKKWKTVKGKKVFAGYEERLYPIADLPPFWIRQKHKTTIGETVEVSYQAFPDVYGLYSDYQKRESIIFNEPGKNSARNEHFQIGSIDVNAYPIDHCDGATAFILHTSDATVGYTGDIRMHGQHADWTKSYLDAAANADIDVLLIEGTRIDETEVKTEDDVEREMEKAFIENDGSRLVIVDQSFRDTERHSIVLRAAARAGREVVDSPKAGALWYLMRVGSFVQKNAKMPELAPSVYEMRKGYDNESDYESFERNVYKKLNFVEDEKIRNNPGKYVVCVSFPQLPKLMDFKPPAGSLMIISQPPAWDRESMAVEEVKDSWRELFGLRQMNIHTHHHAPQQDLLEMVRRIRPKITIPIHTEHPEIYQQMLGNITEVKFIQEGVPLEIRGTSVSTSYRLPSAEPPQPPRSTTWKKKPKRQTVESQKLDNWS